jgi:RNA-binding protein YhbY
MAENIGYNGSEIGSIHRYKQTMDIYDDVTISTNTSRLILNLCNDIAKKIKEQVIDVIGHIAIDANSKA